MKRLSPALLALGVLSTGCPTGWRLERIEGEPASVDPHLWDDVHKTATAVRDATSDSTCGRARRPLIHCAQPSMKALCQSSPDERTALIGPTCSQFTSVLSFLHFSDAQLREHRVHLAGPLSERQYDAFTGTVLRDPDLARNDDAVLLATVLAANEIGALTDDVKAAFAPCNPPAPPRFAVHTGDAVDAGMFSELFTFLADFGELDIPFYNVIGNHDGLLFGTFPPDRVSGLNVVAPYVPILDADRFMRAHNVIGATYDLSVPAAPSREDRDWTAFGCSSKDWNGTTCASNPMPQSNYHGFDLACAAPLRGEGRAAHDALCPEARGYYALNIDVTVSGAPARIRMIVLDTNEVVPESVTQGTLERSRGHVLPEQLRWLERQLSAGPGEPPVFYLVFGHHPIDTFEDEDQAAELRDLMLRNPRVLGYFVGHTHKDGFIKHPRAGGAPALWELVAGSTLVFPQLARVSELLEDHGKLYLRVMSFRQQLGDSAVPQPPIRARRQACRALTLRAARGRASAARDARDADWTAEPIAAPRANGLLLVYDPDNANLGRPAEGQPQ
ncbi:MAG: metallophosphoesterase [Polyangiaceae bacterium]